MLTDIEFQTSVALVDVDVCASVDLAERAVQLMTAKVTDTQQTFLLTRRMWDELEGEALQHADEMWRTP